MFLNVASRTCVMTQKNGPCILVVHAYKRAVLCSHSPPIHPLVCAFLVYQVTARGSFFKYFQKFCSAIEMVSVLWHRRCA